jgi:hypothetical protein
MQLNGFNLAPCLTNYSPSYDGDYTRILRIIAVSKRLYQVINKVRVISSSVSIVLLLSVSLFLLHQYTGEDQTENLEAYKSASYPKYDGRVSVHKVF